jgi:thiol-disulfide isomerase/thioredoxin
MRIKPGEKQMKYLLLPFVLVIAGMAICPAQETISPDVGNVLMQAHAFSAQGKTEKAIEILDDALSRFKAKSFDRYSLLNLKSELLSKLSRDQEAIAVCVEKANIVTSPRQALLVAGAYIKLNEMDSALEWLETSVKRGLLSYAIFSDELYAPLRGDKRFSRLVEAIKKNNGIGRPARPFHGQTVDGKEVSLDLFKGKVLLIDFWATWCPPCMKQMPFLKQYYNELHAGNFEIVSVALETDIDKLKIFLQTNAMAWPNMANEKGQYDALAAIYGVKNIPASFLIDKKGILRHMNLAENDLRNAIIELAKE